MEEALGLVGLEAFGDRMSAELSGGQQQRVAVARALVKRPAVLLLDEPLGALDLKLRQRLQIELSQIHRDVGTTFVYVTHDQEEAMSMADRIAVMNDGRVEQLGTPEEIYRRPASRFVADFIGDSNFFTATVDGGSAELADGSRVPCGDGARCGDADGAARVDSARRHGKDRSRERRPHVVPRQLRARRGADAGVAGAGHRRAARGVAGSRGRRRRRALVGCGGRHRARGGVTTAAVAAPRRARLLGLGTRFASYGGFVPAIILLGLFFLVPLGIIVCYSFWETIDYSVVHHWTLDNYHYFFSVSAYVTTMWATLWVAVARDGDRDRARVPVRLLAVALRARRGSARRSSCS